MVYYFLSILIAITTMAIGQVTIDLELLTTINLSFLLGLVCLTLGACLFVFQTGFLDLFLDGYKRMQAFVVPKTRSMERVDKMVKEDPNFSSWKYSLYTKVKVSFLGLGSGLIGFSFTSMLFM